MSAEPGFPYLGFCPIQTYGSYNCYHDPETCEYCKAIEPDDTEHPDHDDNFYNPGVRMTVMIPGDVYNAIVDVSDDNGQSPEVTVCAALDKMFTTTPVLIPLDVSALSVLYLPSGKSVSDILPGKAKSARIEVLL